MSGNTAIVAIGGGKAKLVDLTTPSNPSISGELSSGIGTRLALTGSNLLVSTYRTYLAGVNNPLQGLHVAAFDPIAAVGTRATLSKVVDATRAPQSDPEEETLEDSPVRLNVFPSTYPVAEPMLRLFRNGVPLGDPISLVVSGGRALYNLVKGFRKKVTDVVTAQFSYQADGQEVKSPPKEVPIGTISIRVDSNNDTIVAQEDTPDDQKDQVDAAGGKSFGFWEADSNAQGENVLVDYATLSLRARITLRPEHRVALRLKDRTWDVRVKGSAYGQPLPADCPKEKAYLCDPKTAEVQMEIIDSNGPAFWEGWIRRLPLVQLPPELPRPIPRPGGIVELPQDLLSTPFRTVITPQGEWGRRYISETPFLFKARGRTVTPPPGTPPPEEVLEVGWINDGGEFVKLNEAKVEIKKLKDLTSMLTLRGSPVPSSDWRDPHFQVAADAQGVAGWEALGPKLESAKNVTLIVHGYAVAQDEFLDGRGQSPSEFQLLTKRLYWAGHPVLEAQDKARVVGVSWPGDLPGGINSIFQWALSTDNTRPYFQEDEFNAFLSGIPLAAKLQELRSAGPDGRKINILAHSLGNLVVNSALQRLAGGGKPINYVMLQAAVTSEAFMQNYNPLDPGQLAVAGVRDLVKHAQDLGFPNPDEGRPTPDWNWLNQENEVFQKLNEYPAPYACPREEPYQAYTNPDCGEPDVRPRPPVWQCDAARCHNATVFQRGWTALDKSLTPTPIATDLTEPPTDPSYFNTRWGKFRSGEVVQGAWTAFFRANVSPTAPPPGIRVFNAYNHDDYVLRIDRPYHERLPYLLDFIRYGLLGLFGAELNSQNIHAWKALQILSKPFSPPGPEPALNRVRDIFWQGGARDALDQQKWWTLEVEGRPSPWQTTIQIPTWVVGLTGGDLKWIRRRAELAMWFPALAAPAGVVPLDALGGASPVGNLNLAAGRNVDMSGIGGTEGPNANGTPSHSYAGMKKYQEVWKGFRAFKTMFEQQ